MNFRSLAQYVRKLRRSGFNPTAYVVEHWYAPEVGLVRSKNSDGDTVLELASPPCLSSSFDGGCVTE